ncbi:hypothetical protein [Vibrio vulnificus]|nr:hypothetical protein [Vibrio vulnificus]
MTEDFSEGPFTKDEVIALLGNEYEAEEYCYECYGFNCILDFYEMSGGYYCESHILTRPNRYSLYRCCARYGSIEDKRRFNRNVVWAGEDLIVMWFGQEKCRPLTCSRQIIRKELH